MNKAMLNSYVRNLFGQVLGAVVIVMQTSGISSPIEFTQHEWLLVANAIWASLVPVALRWANKQDPAFGRVANLAVAEVTRALQKEAAKPVKKAAATPAKKAVKKKK